MTDPTDQDHADLDAAEAILDRLNQRLESTGSSLRYQVVAGRAPRRQKTGDDDA